jgi:hypothetical protein
VCGSRYLVCVLFHALLQRGFRCAGEGGTGQKRRQEEQGAAPVARVSSACVARASVRDGALVWLQVSGIKIAAKDKNKGKKKR